jgi:hypothetical protein
MAEQNAGLKLNITADASGALSSTEALQTSLGRVEELLGSAAAAGTAAGTTITEGAAGASTALLGTAGAAEKAGATIGAMSAETSAAARAFSSMGFSAGAASERILGLGEAMTSLGAVAGPLLAVAAAILAVGAALDFVHKGVEEAGHIEDTMNRIGEAVKRQGGDWNKGSQEVMRWAELVEKATIFSKGEALDAINRLTSAHVSEADALKITTAAMGMAAETHHSLNEIVQALTSSEAGRGQALVKLDLNLKDVIHTHGTLSQVLKEITDYYSHAATDSVNTYEGKQALLKNTLSDLSVTIGKDLIPGLTGVADFMIGLTQVIEKNLHTWEKWGSGIVHTASSAAHNAGAAAVAVYDATVKPVNALLDLTEQGAVAQPASTPMSRKFGGIGPTNDKASLARQILAGVGTDISADFHAASELDNDNSGATGFGFIDDITKHARAEIAKAKADFVAEQVSRAKRALDSNPNMGNAKTGGSAGAPAGSFEPVADSIAAKQEGLSTSQEAMKRGLAALTSGELEFRDAVRDAGSASDQQNAKLALGKKETADAAIAIDLIARTTSEYVAQLDTLKPAQDSERQAYESARGAFNAYKSSHDDGNALTKTQIAQERELKGHMDTALKNYNTTASAIQILNTHLDENSRLLEVNRTKLDAQAAAEGEAARAAKAKADALAKNITKMQESIALQAANVSEEESLYGTSLQYQLQHFTAKRAALKTSDDDYIDEYKKASAEIQNIDKEMFKQRIDAEKSFVATVVSTESSFLDTVLTKHQSFANDLKSLWKDITKEFTKSVEEMVLKSALLGNINQGIGNAMFGGGQGGSGGGLGSLAGGSSSQNSNASQGGIFGALLGTAGASQVASSLPTNGGTMGLLYGSSVGANTVSATYSDASGNSYSTGGASHGSLLGGAIKGAALGETVSGALNPNGNAGMGALGGALGGVIAAVTAANPIAGAALSIGGSLIGSLFGNHTTPEQSPDTSQPGYQQFLADVEGKAVGSHGVNTYAEAQYDTSIAGSGGSLADQVSKYVNNPSAWMNATAQMKADVATLKKLEGPSGSLALNLSNPESQGMFHLANGQSISVTEYERLMHEVQAGASAMGGMVPIFQMTRSSPNFQSTVGPQSGTFNPQTGQYEAMGGTSGSMRTTGMGMTVNVDLSNTSIVGSVPDAVVNQIVTRLRDVTGGIVPGSFNTSLAQRKTGN